MRFPLIALFLMIHFIASAYSATIYGKVEDDAGSPRLGARVTLFEGRTSYFKEVRSSSDGSYRFNDVLAAECSLGASFPGREYRDIRIAGDALGLQPLLQLGLETNKGRWKILRTLRENTFGGTDSGVLLPDGRIMYCHDTRDPIILDPGTNTLLRPPPSPRPEIKNLQQKSVRRGDRLSFTIEKTSSPSRIVLIGTSARTHFMDSGNARHVELKFVQSGQQISAFIPHNAAKIPPGYYILFAMVDDIPSKGTILQVQ